MTCNFHAGNQPGRLQRARFRVISCNIRPYQQKGHLRCVEMAFWIRKCKPAESAESAASGDDALQRKQFGGRLTTTNQVYLVAINQYFRSTTAGVVVGRHG